VVIRNLLLPPVFGQICETRLGCTWSGHRGICEHNRAKVPPVAPQGLSESTKHDTAQAVDAFVRQALGIFYLYCASRVWMLPGSSSRRPYATDPRFETLNAPNTKIQQSSYNGDAFHAMPRNDASRNAVPVRAIQPRTRPLLPNSLPPTPPTPPSWGKPMMADRCCRHRFLKSPTP